MSDQSRAADQTFRDVPRGARTIEVPLAVLVAMLYADGMEQYDAEMKLRRLVDGIGRPTTGEPSGD